ncbi:MAG: hypothetical protein ACTSSH_11130, partial [Candidatus Heimdallarchaeota archaeon]
LVKESHYLASLHYNLKVIGWDDFPFFPDGFAGNASLLYMLLKMLYREQPKTVLELGSGQSTLFTSRYTEANDKAKLLVLEDYEEWHERFKSKVVKNDRIRFIHSPLEEIKIKNRKCLWYSTKILAEEDTKYQLILVDGPIGTYRFSRVGILNFIPKILDPENFTIIFDDTSRKGELDTIRLLKKILRKNNIQFSTFKAYGSKRQTCITSPNKAYLASDWAIF